MDVCGMSSKALAMGSSFRLVTSILSAWQPCCRVFERLAADSSSCRARLSSSASTTMMSDSEWVFPNKDAEFVKKLVKLSSEGGSLPPFVCRKNLCTSSNTPFLCLHRVAKISTQDF